jgi:hypothetical protein
MGKLIKIRESLAMEVYDELVKLRWQAGKIDFGDREGMPVIGWEKARAQRDARLAEWDRGPLGRLYQFLQKKLN